MARISSSTIFTCAFLLLAGSGPWVQPAAAQEQLEGPDEPDAWYPRTRTSAKGSVLMQAPQVVSWEDFERIEGWAAFQVTVAGSSTSPYGSLHFRARTETDLENREVLLYEPELLSLEISGLEEDAPEYAAVRAALLAQPTKVPLDLVLEYLPQEIPLGSTEGLNPEPPQIFVSTSPALLVSVDTKAIWVPVTLSPEATGSEIEFVLNTNWDLFRESEGAALFLRYGRSWLTAPVLEGPWSWAETLPPELWQLPDDGNWGEVREALPPATTTAPPPSGAAPRVFVASEPAELLLLDGQPLWQNVGSEGLLFATNTQQELLRLGQTHYLLLSGRWFSATDLDGPWKLERQLPKEFLAIPADHTKGYLRASVPGTREAWEAALVASIPRKVTVDRKTAEGLEIALGLAGEPVFLPIEGTNLGLAVNTSYQLFELTGPDNATTYYLCYNALWLESASPTGPWRAATSLPVELEEIPPSSPAYNTTFVKIEETTPDSVTYSYTSGYEGAYVVDDTVVHGTGFWVAVAAAWALFDDADFYYGYPIYPYYPWPPSYGYGSWFDPSTGRYGEAIVGYGPYGAAGSAAVFNPTTGVYARGQAVWDSDEYAGRGYAYNPNTDTGLARNRYRDLEDDEGWSQRLTTRGDEWRYTESEWEDGHMRTEFETSRGAEGEIDRERDGDTLSSEGSIERGGRETEFATERERRGDSVVTEGTITGENRSAELDSVREDGEAAIRVEGSEGSTGEFRRELDDGEISGSGTISRDGKTIETDTTRSAEGVQRELETSEGGQGAVARQGDERAFVGESGSGDVYAGRDGEVYKKGDDGWSKVENPRSGAATDANAREGSASTLSTTQRQQLERDSRSRARGLERYGSYQRSRPAGRRGGGRGGR